MRKDGSRERELDFFNQKSNISILNHPQLSMDRNETGIELELETQINTEKKDKQEIQEKGKINCCKASTKKTHPEKVQKNIYSSSLLRICRYSRELDHNSITNKSR